MLHGVRHPVSPPASLAGTRRTGRFPVITATITPAAADRSGVSVALQRQLERTKATQPVFDVLTSFVRSAQGRIHEDTAFGHSRTTLAAQGLGSALPSPELHRLYTGFAGKLVAQTAERLNAKAARFHPAEYAAFIRCLTAMHATYPEATKRDTAADVLTALLYARGPGLRRIRLPVPESVRLERFALDMARRLRTEATGPALTAAERTEAALIAASRAGIVYGFYRKPPAAAGS